MAGNYTIRKRGQGAHANPPQTDAQFVAATREQVQSNYREQSLRIHGLVCGKCGREFELANLHLLTVHHKDGNHHNNPLDGTNWENLCAYCHEDAHARLVLANRTLGASPNAQPAASDRQPSTPIGTLGDLLAAKLKGQSGR